MTIIKNIEMNQGGAASFHYYKIDGSGGINLRAMHSGVPKPNVGQCSCCLEKNKFHATVLTFENWE